MNFLKLFLSNFSHFLKNVFPHFPQQFLLPIICAFLQKMPCQCIPPPPIFDVPPPPDPSLILHLLLDEPSTASNGGNKFQQFSAAQSCPAASSPSSVGAFFAAWWAQFERAGADFFLPWLALLLFALCLISSGAALALRWRRRSRKMLRDGTTEGGNAANGQSRKRPSKSQNSSASMASPGGLPMVCGGGYSSSTSADSPEHFGACGAVAHFAAHSSTETMASAASPLEQQKPQKGWLFQPNFFTAFSSPNAGSGGLFRPNTVGASRRKMPSSSSHHCPSSVHRHHHHFHHHPPPPHSSCCSPPGSSQNCCPFAGSPPRTVALRMPRHFSSHEGQFVAWQMVGTENAIGSAAGSFYGFGGNENGGGGGSELYEELAGENEEIIAEAPYKRRQLQTSLKRMPPPSSRPPPPPPEHSMLDVGIIGGDGGQHLEGISKGISKVISEGSSKGSSKGSLASTSASDEDVEIGSPKQIAEGNQTTPSAANAAASNGIGGGGGQSSSRTESGYGTGGRGPKRRRIQEKGNNNGGSSGAAGGLWRNAQQQNILAGHFVGGGGIRPHQNWPKDNNILVDDDADVDENGPNEYVDRQGGGRHKAMTYV